MRLRLLATSVLLALLAGCASSGSYSSRSSASSADGATAGNLGDERVDDRCRTCGVVERIERSAAAQAARADESLQGGIVGGVLGNDAKDQPKPAGPQTFRISVRLDDGSLVTVTQRDLGGVRAGSYVRVQDGRADPHSR